MSKHEELIATLRASAAAMPFDAAVAVQYRAAADALEAQAREIEGLRKDAERYRALVDVMESAKRSADLQVNEHLLYRDTCEPGEEVSLTWFPHTSVESLGLQGKSINEVVDALIAERGVPHG